MDKKVSGAVVSSALPTPAGASMAATPIIATEGLSFFGVSIADWVYVLVAIFYAISAVHVAHKIYVRHRWARQNLVETKDGVVNINKRVSDDVLQKLIEADKNRGKSEGI